MISRVEGGPSNAVELSFFCNTIPMKQIWHMIIDCVCCILLISVIVR